MFLNFPLGIILLFSLFEASEMDNRPKVIESKSSAYSFITNLADGALVVRKVRDPTFVEDPSVVNFIPTESSGEYLIKFSDKKFLCSHPEKSHIGICNMPEMKSTHFTIVKQKDYYLIKQGKKCVRRHGKITRGKLKFRLKLKNCEHKRSKWRIRNVDFDIPDEEPEEESTLPSESKKEKGTTIMDRINEFDYVAGKRDKKLENIEKGMAKTKTPFHLKDSNSSDEDPMIERPFVYLNDEGVTKKVLKEDEEGIPYYKNQHCPQPYNPVSFKHKFYNFYDFLSDRIPVLMPAGKLENPCSGSDSKPPETPDTGKKEKGVGKVIETY